MSIKIQRIQSREAGPFAVNGGRTRAHIEVPSSVGFSDLQNSNVVFRMESQVQRPDGTSKLLPSFIAQPQILANGTRDNTQPVSVQGAQALIKNSRVTSDTYGVLNEQRDQNVISANLDWYNDYSSCQAARATYDGDVNQNGDANLSSGLDSGVFIRPSRPRNSGNDASVKSAAGSAGGLLSESRAVNAELKVPLKHVDRLADGTRQFPNISVGDITYRLELEDVRPVMSLGPSFSADCQDIAAGIDTKIGTVLCPIRYRWERETDVAGNTHLSQVQKLSLESLPFYIGMPVQVVYTAAGVAAQSCFTTISKLTLQDTGGTAPLDQDNVILIETTHPCPLTGAASTAAVTLISITLDQSNNANAGEQTPIADGLQPTVNYNIIDVFLELHTIQLTPQQIQQAQQALQSLQIPYLEHRLTKKVLNLTSDYAETLHVDAGCAGLCVLTPQNNGLVSGYNNCNSYRFSWDGRNVTNRSIAIGPRKSNQAAGGARYGTGRQLHNHMIMKFFGNIGKVVQKFDAPAENYDGDYAGNSQQLDVHSIFPLVTPMVGQDMIAQFQCTSPTAMATKEMFYVSMYPRTLNFQKGQLVM